MNCRDYLLNLSWRVLGNSWAHYDYVYGFVRITVATWLSAWSNLNELGHDGSQDRKRGWGGSYAPLPAQWALISIAITFLFLYLLLLFLAVMCKWSLLVSRCGIIFSRPSSVFALGAFNFLFSTRVYLPLFKFVALVRENLTPRFLSCRRPPPSSCFPSPPFALTSAIGAAIQSFRRSRLLLPAVWSSEHGRWWAASVCSVCPSCSTHTFTRAMHTRC